TIDTTTQCTGNNPINFINNNPNGIAGKRMIVWDCPSGTPVFLDGSGSKTLTFTQDTAMVSETGFNQSNNMFYSGVGNPDNWTLYWIVPSDTPGVQWSAGMPSRPTCTSPLTGDVGDIRFNQMKISGLNWFAYTPCEFYL